MVGMKALPYLVVVRPLVGDKIHTKKNLCQGGSHK